MEKKDNNFWSKSYHQHIELEKKNAEDKRTDTWKQFDTVDAWRHKRMYDSLLPIIHVYPESSWLTVGDGRFGTDSNYLIRNGIKNVLTTSISDNLIKQAKNEGFILDYQTENAEKLTFGDNSFDFVLCKESYHHFPRPMIALYEMIRVAKNGVVLIEPNDQSIDLGSAERTIRPVKSRLAITKNYIKDMLRIPRYDFSEPAYETVGNYVYTISEREIEKVALGLNLPSIAFKGLNDFYSDGVEYEKADDSSSLFSKTKSEILKLDKTCRSGYSTYGLLVALILKTRPEKEFMAELTKDDFKIFNLQRNPYAND